MKIAGILLTFIFSILLLIDVGVGIIGSYKYDLKYKSYWSLADKASTIPQKSEYIDKFVGALEAGGFSGKYNAIWLKTPDNSFDHNLEALKSLQLRLHEIQNMDVSSFQYQTAIQQITAQEQGEAKEMLQVFRGVWWKENHFFLWRWVGVAQVMIVIIVLIIGIAVWATDDY